ncbi:MAG: helix-turn-helix domain-containing protein [Luminiphilus sp.]
MKWENIDTQVCSVARALAIVGERWTLLIIRDAFKGTRRFDDFYRNLGVTRHRLAQRLAGLVEAGVMTRVPYNDRPVRYEYRLTRMGLGLYPVLMTLGDWGDRWLDNGQGPPTEYWHARCGKVTGPVISCRECGDPLRPEEVSARPGPLLRDFLQSLAEQGVAAPDEAALPAAAAEFALYWAPDNGEETP